MLGHGHIHSVGVRGNFFQLLQLLHIPSGQKVEGQMCKLDGEALRT